MAQLIGNHTLRQSQIHSHVSPSLCAFLLHSHLGKSIFQTRPNSLFQYEESLFSRKPMNYLKGNIRGLQRRNHGFFVELIFFGVSFNFKRIKYYTRSTRILELELLFNKKIRVTLPTGVFARVFKRRCLLFSYDRPALIRFKEAIKRMRPANSYTGLGARQRSQYVPLKIGKKRVR